MEKKRDYKATEHGDRSREYMQTWYNETEYRREKGPQEVGREDDHQCIIDSTSLGGTSVFFFFVLLPLGRPRGLFPG